MSFCFEDLHQRSLHGSSIGDIQFNGMDLRITRCESLPIASIHDRPICRKLFGNLPSNTLRSTGDDTYFVF